MTCQAVSDGAYLPKTRRFSLLKIKQLLFAYLKGFIFYGSQRREETLNEWNYRSLFLKIGFSFWLISDLPISGWSGFPHFRFSVYPGFHISGYVSTCIRSCRVGWMEGLCINQFQLRPAPHTLGYCGAFERLVSPGGGAFANFVLPGGRAFANPELLTRPRFPIRI